MPTWSCVCCLTKRFLPPRYLALQHGSCLTITHKHFVQSYSHADRQLQNKSIFQIQTIHQEEECNQEKFLSIEILCGVGVGWKKNSITQLSFTIHTISMCVL